jgi:U3 small nucleolar RNA-associated protein 14
MTLKHKAFGKFGKSAKKSNNPILKQQLQDAYRIGHELRRKIDTINGEEDDDEGDEEGSGEGEEGSGGDEGDAEEKPRKGLMAMKFMERGVQRQKVEYQEMKEQMRQEEEERIRLVLVFPLFLV